MARVGEPGLRPAGRQGGCGLCATDGSSPASWWRPACSPRPARPPPSRLHLLSAQYTGGAGAQGPSFTTPGGSGENLFLFAPVYNFGHLFVGRNPFPPIPFFVNPTNGIWNAATDMTIKFTQRFDNWDAVGRFPVFETENARTYAIAGGRLSWLWERFEWRTVKPTIFTPDGVDCQFEETPDS